MSGKLSLVVPPLNSVPAQVSLHHGLGFGRLTWNNKRSCDWLVDLPVEVGTRLGGLLCCRQLAQVRLLLDQLVQTQRLLQALVHSRLWLAEFLGGIQLRLSGDTQLWRLLRHEVHGLLNFGLLCFNHTVSHYRAFDLLVLKELVEAHPLTLHSRLKHLLTDWNQDSLLNAAITGLHVAERLLQIFTLLGTRLPLKPSGIDCGIHELVSFLRWNVATLLLILAQHLCLVVS